MNLFNSFLPSIPSDAFDGLQSLVIADLGRNYFTVLEANLFKELEDLRLIYLDMSPIAKVKNFALATPTTVNDIEIVFSSGAQDGINWDAFEPLALAGINRPATIAVGGFGFTKLKKEAFSHFLTSHPEHVIRILLPFENITCDCDWLWIWKERSKFKERFQGDVLWCDGFVDVEIWDMKDDDFGECKVVDDVIRD